MDVNTAIAPELFAPLPSSLNPVQPWHWRQLPLAKRSGSHVFEALFLNPRGDSTLGNDLTANYHIATLLESPLTPNPTHLARYSICAGSPRLMENQPQLWTPPVGNILPFLRRLLQVQKPESPLPAELPFTGGWLGWLGYDLAWEIEQLPHLNDDLMPFPIAYWYEPESFAVLDHHQQILWLATTDSTQLDSLQRQLEEADRETGVKHPAKPDKSNPITPIFHSSQHDYMAAVQQAKRYIQAGDIFQVNLSLRFEAHTALDSWSIYRALQQINPSPFASYWQTPWGAMISCSPERLIQLSGTKVETRPIAGTRKRGATSTQDEQLAQELIANKKERAEHIMLVDLERNDIGKVCEWGTVQVNEILTIERYSHVMHLVSNIMGTLSPKCDPIDLIQGVFPGGTITGCPKVRCMEIIEELEPVKRNLFYGSCGYLDWRGNLDLNILIRTLLYSKSSHSQAGATVWGQVGAGIVADSDPQKEWYESLQKAQAQLNALNLQL
ncbi:MAG: anthranilate synthase component I [Coleofasciculus chthonoplastes F3-SA18-01]|uniref:anthranilate synthase component I n=1 Tax=Coleofasciculus chthonoplastes TaxID=64178 RepID=UPI0032F8A18C